MAAGAGPKGVGVVIPALDEEESIAAVVRAVPGGLVDEVIVVDNGSRDRTAAVARAAGARVIAEPRRGYGAACWAGVQALGAVDVVAFLDGDGSQDPAELPRVVDPILAGCADLVLGARRFGPGAEHPWHAVLGTRAVAWLLRYRCGAVLRDVGPYRAVRRDALLTLGIEDRSYGWPVEMVARAARAGLRIAEVEVTQRPRLGGRSKVAGTMRGSLGAGWRFVRVAWRA
jgi:glycosyltransferase involved in cell wall biosynthesis